MKYDKVSEVQIILTGTALRNARREVRKSKAAQLAVGATNVVQRIGARIQAWLDTRNFKGPRFVATGSNRIVVAIGAATVNVGWSNGNKAGEYVYPLSTVGRVKTIAA